MIFVTPTIIDPAGNRYHSEDEMPFAQYPDSGAEAGGAEGAIAKEARMSFSLLAQMFRAPRSADILVRGSPGVCRADKDVRAAGGWRRRWRGCAGLALGQGVYVTNGIEYAIAGSLPGDQVYPAVAITTNGGFLVWEDNVTDGDGTGISAVRLDSNFSQVYSPFRVNQLGAGSQDHPQVAMLTNGGAAFVWQGGQPGFQHIYARFLSPTNTWLTPTNDIHVNTFTNHAQIDPALATLANGNVVMVWSSFNQSASNSLQVSMAKSSRQAGRKWAASSRSASTFRSTSATPRWRRWAAAALWWCGPPRCRGPAPWTTSAAIRYPSPIRSRARTFTRGSSTAPARR